MLHPTLGAYPCGKRGVFLSLGILRPVSFVECVQGQGCSGALPRDSNGIGKLGDHFDDASCSLIDETLPLDSANRGGFIVIVPIAQRTHDIAEIVCSVNEIAGLVDATN